MTTDLARQTDEPRGLAVADPEAAAGALAHVLGTGDLYQLSNEQRVAHYINLCTSLGLNPLSRPFQWIEFKEGEDKPAVLTLYFKPSGAAQMLRNHRVSVHYPRKEIVGELFVCEAHGQAPDGRKGVGTKYVPLTNRYGKLSGNRLANAFMSAESGALRRLALNMFGLSTGPDPDEAASIRTVYVDGTGQVLDAPTDEQRYLAENPHAARAIGEPTFEDADVDDFDGPSQGPRTEELTPPERPRTRTLLGRTSDEDVKRWLGAWFGAVKGTPWDTDESRASYVAAWTADEWPKAKRTDSLRTMFTRCTADEAAAFLAQIRADVATWKERQEAEPFDDDPSRDAPTVARPMADLTDEEIEARFEQGTERLLGRPPKTDTGPTRTQLVAELRSVVTEVRDAGGTVELPDDLTALDDAAVAAWTAELRKALDGLKAAF